LKDASTLQYRHFPQVGLGGGLRSPSALIVAVIIVTCRVPY